MATFQQDYPHLRRNMALFTLDYVAFGVAFGMVGSNTALIPDFVSQLTENKGIIGMVTALYTFTWLVPQLLLAQIVNRRERRKLFMLPAPFFRLVMIGVAVVIAAFGADNPTATLIVFCIGYWLFAAGDSIVTLSWSDVLGSSIPNQIRGTMFGIGQILVAFGALGMSALARWALSPDGLPYPMNYAFLFGVAGLFFVIGGVGLALTIEEKAKVKHPPGPTMGEYGAFLGNILKTDREFRRFVRTRLCFDFAHMSIPFYTVLGTRFLGLSSDTVVGDSIILFQLGNAIGGVLMGVISRISGSRFVIVAAGISITGEAIFALIAYLGGGQAALYGSFFLLGASASMTYPSYTDWIITHAPPDRRPIYIGLTNTISAVSNLAPLLGGVLLQITAITALGYFKPLLPAGLPLEPMTQTLYPVVFVASAVLGILGLIATTQLHEPRHRETLTTIHVVPRPKS